ncbi:hypothetical protein MKX01_026272, partial [Papaver californicum]
FVYVMPFETDTILLTPGQTSNVLLKTKHFHPHASFVMAARPYVTGQGTTPPPQEPSNMNLPLCSNLG